MSKSLCSLATCLLASLSLICLSCSGEVSIERQRSIDESFQKEFKSNLESRLESNAEIFALALNRNALNVCRNGQANTNGLNELAKCTEYFDCVKQSLSMDKNQMVSKAIKLISDSNLDDTKSAAKALALAIDDCQSFVDVNAELMERIRLQAGNSIYKNGLLRSNVFKFETCKQFLEVDRVTLALNLVKSQRSTLSNMLDLVRKSL